MTGWQYWYGIRYAYNLSRMVLLLFLIIIPFYRWENQGTKLLSSKGIGLTKLMENIEVNQNCMKIRTFLVQNIISLVNNHYIFIHHFIEWTNLCPSMNELTKQWIHNEKQIQEIQKSFSWVHLKICTIEYLS